MLTLLHLLESPVLENASQNPSDCATPGCRHHVKERWDDAGLLCANCAIESELFDRDGRWLDVTRVPGVRWLSS